MFKAIPPGRRTKKSGKNDRKGLIEGDEMTPNMRDFFGLIVLGLVIALILQALNRL